MVFFGQSGASSNNLGQFTVHKMLYNHIIVLNYLITPPKHAIEVV